MVKEKHRLVFPGSYICSVEEFIAGKNTYTEDNGIYSAVCGFVLHEGKIVHVINKEKQGPVIDIIGGILDLVDTCAFVVPVMTIPKDAKRFIPDTLPLPVSHVSRGYLRSIREVVRIGDIIRARVIKGPNGYEVAFVERNHGVVKAFCSRCRAPMFLKGNSVICSMCKNVERRKISSEYGLINLRIR